MVEQNFISNREFKYGSKDTFTKISYDEIGNILIEGSSKNDSEKIIISINSEELGKIIDVLKKEKPYNFKDADDKLKARENIENKDLELCIIIFTQLFGKEYGYKRLLEFVKNNNINAQVKNN